MAGLNMLLPGEEIYLESSKLPLTLTNLRVLHRYSFLVDAQFDSITLEAIASVGLRTISRLWMLFLAGILLLMSLWVSQQGTTESSNAAGGLAFVGVVFIGLYFATRRRYIIIESNGGFLMQVPSHILPLDECYFTIHAIDRAKLEFVHNMPPHP
jgi:hypothetical protein